MVNIYCPACGTWHKVKIREILPAVEIEWTCSGCKTVFVIAVTYKPVNDD